MLFVSCLERVETLKSSFRMSFVVSFQCRLARKSGNNPLIIFRFPRPNRCFFFFQNGLCFPIGAQGESFYTKITWCEALSLQLPPPPFLQFRNFQRKSRKNGFFRPFGDSKLPKRGLLAKKTRFYCLNSSQRHLILWSVRSKKCRKIYVAYNRPQWMF